MKIARIQRIKTHRVFRDFTWPSNGLPNLGRFNLIYGWNGTGKTTLSGLFRHLQGKEPITDGDVQFLIDAKIVYGNALATSILPQVRVFNRDTVNRSIFESPHEQLSPIYIIGEDSTEKQRQIEQLKQRAAELAKAELEWDRKKSFAETSFETFCTDRAREIKNLLTASGGGPYNNDNARGFKQTVQKLMVTSLQIQRLTTEQRQQCLATKDGAPREKLAPLFVSYSDCAELTHQVQQLLVRSVLSNTLTELVSDPALATWVGQGLLLHTGENARTNCRFCTQPILAEHLTRLEAHFNDEFRRLQSDAAALINTVESAKKRITTFHPPSKALLYPQLVEKYETYICTLHQQLDIIAAYLDALAMALKTKQKEPFNPLNLVPFLTDANPPTEPSGTLEEVFQLVLASSATMSAFRGQDIGEKINALISEHNEYTENFTREVSIARRALEEDLVAKVIPDYRAKQKAITVAEKELAAQRKAAEDIRCRIAALEQEIRNHQRPADELNQEMAAYLGHNELQFEVRETGYSITRSSQPAMHLSEGERTSIAFMYFLKSLVAADFDLKRGVIVIDDPISGLDANALSSAFRFMKARIPAPGEFDGQLFVLTHNFTFFEQVKNWFDHIETSSRQGTEPVRSELVRFYMLKSPTIQGQRHAQICLLDHLLPNYELEHSNPVKYGGTPGLIEPSSTSRGLETTVQPPTGERSVTYNAQRALDLLRLGSGLPDASFREGQEEAICHVVEGRGRLLVVQKTGWGKSFVYFIATKLLREAGNGPVLLISPLLALMRNQIAAADRMGVRAVTINSDNQDEWKNVEAALASNKVDNLLISPERLANERFIAQVLADIADQIALLVIDEAHCISDWGHDFRPHYRLLERIVRMLPPNIRLLATTATANNRVMDDLQTVLGPYLDLSRGDLNRPSLVLQTIRLPSQAERLAWLAAQVPALQGHGIIYTLTVRDAVQVAEWLRTCGLNVASYTGRTGEGRAALEQALLENRVKALVATTALGMGFDKPDLALVIHYQAPASVVAYYQQVGRAGRALDAAYGVLLSGAEEIDITNYFIESAFPARAEVNNVLGALEAAPAGLSVPELLAKINLSRGRIEKTIALLSLESPAPIAIEFCVSNERAIHLQSQI